MIVVTKIKEYKNWMLFGILIFFLIHMAVFTNYFPCWDTYGSLQMEYTSQRGVGRWLFGPASILLHSRYDLGWISGVLSSFFVTLSSILLIDLWKLEKRFHRGLLIFIVAVFPSMTACYVYVFTAAAYMFAFFLSIAAVYLSIIGNKKNFKYMVISAVCICISLAIYQAYILNVVAALVMYIAKAILNEKICTGLKNAIFRTISSIICGGALYKAIEVVYQYVDRYSNSNYQGISEVGALPISQIPEAVKNIFRDSFRFFFWNENCVYRVLNILTLSVIILVALCFSINKWKTNKFKAIILIICSIIFVPITYSFYLVSPGVEYHRVMEFGNCYIYLLPIVLFENTDQIVMKLTINQFINNVAVTLLICICFYYSINDNVIYKQLEVYTERTRYETYEVLNKIDEIAAGNTREIAIIGFFRLESERYKISPIPDTVGINRNYHAVPQSFCNFADFYYGRKYYLAPQDKIDAIKETEEYRNMGIYPKGDYVKEINGTIVINL